jgi:hypothetical protein
MPRLWTLASALQRRMNMKEGALEEEEAEEEATE